MAKTAAAKPTTAAPTPAILPLTSAAALVVAVPLVELVLDAGEVMVALEEATPEAAAPLIVAVVPPVEAELRAAAQMALPTD